MYITPSHTHMLNVSKWLVPRASGTVYCAIIMRDPNMHLEPGITFTPDFVAIQEHQNCRSKLHKLASKVS